MPVIYIKIPHAKNLVQTGHFSPLECRKQSTTAYVRSPPPTKPSPPIITLIIEQSNNNDHQVKDVRVPEQLQRAMAAEAEAAREARAKVMVVMIVMVREAREKITL